MKALRTTLALALLAGCSYDWDGLRPLNNPPPDVNTDTGADTSTVFPEDTRDSGTPVDMTVMTDTGVDARADVVLDSGADVTTDAPMPVDVVRDAGADVPADVALDVALDVAPDVTVDVPADTGIDTGVDVPRDVPVDTGIDTGVDVPCNAHVVINEFAVAGPMGASDEFVEFFNTGTCTVSLDNWTLKYSAASGSTPSTMWTGPLGASLAPGAYFVLAPAASTSYATARTAVFNPGMAAAGGSIALFGPLATIAHDGVAYGTLTGTSPFIEGSMPAPVPTASQSVSRLPNGADTNANSADFRISGAVTVGAVNR